MIKLYDHMGVIAVSRSACSGDVSLPTERTRVTGLGRKKEFQERGVGKCKGKCKGKWGQGVGPNPKRSPAEFRPGMGPGAAQA
mgnify:FL=1